MKHSKVLIYSAALAGLLTVGTIGIRAAPTCVRIVKVYRDRVVHHRVSSETKARWAVWAKEHPNFRPKHKAPLTPKETFKKVAVACELPVANDTFAGLLPPQEENGFITSAEAPVYIATAEPLFTLAGTPLTVTPLPPTDILPTPEPSSVILLGSALALLLFFKRDKFFEARSDR